jgi:hypothetical protein
LPSVVGPARFAAAFTVIANQPGKEAPPSMELVTRPVNGHGRSLFVLLATAATLSLGAQALSPAPASAWTTTCSEPVCEGGNPSGGPATDAGIPDGPATDPDDPGDHSYERPDPPVGDDSGPNDTGDHSYERPDSLGGELFDPGLIFHDIKIDPAVAVWYQNPAERLPMVSANCRMFLRRAQKIRAYIADSKDFLPKSALRPREKQLEKLDDQYAVRDCDAILQGSER